MPEQLWHLDRNRLGLIGIGLAVILFLAINLLAGGWLPGSGSILPTITCSPCPKAPTAAAVDRRAGRSAALLHPAARRARALFSSHARRVEELLAASERLSGGKVRVEHLDPAPFSPEEDLAVAEGLEGLPLKDDGTLAYLGLTGRNSTDDLKAISYLAPERADSSSTTSRASSTSWPTGQAHGRADNHLPLIGAPVNRFHRGVLVAM